MQKKIILLALAIALLIGGVVLVWQKKMAQEVPEEEVKEMTTTDTTPSIDTADWKTYRNEEYGFEVRYPREWANPSDPRLSGGVQTVFLKQEGYSEGCCSGIRIELRSESMQEVYSQLVQDYPKEDILSSTEQNFSGMKTKQLLFLTHYGDKNERVFIVPFSKNRTVVFRYGDGDVVSSKVLNSLSIFKDE